MQLPVKYSSFLFILFLAFSHSLSAQLFIQLTGKVEDDKTREPIPYATVRLKEVPIGTITNLRGEFSFWLSSAYGKGTLQVSSVGFHDFEIAVSEFTTVKEKVILLNEDIRLQPGVVVVSDKLLTGLEVLKRAVARIPENYINEQHAFKAYYRETVSENGAVIKFADAAVTFDQTGYDGESYDRENFGGRELVRMGPWLGGYKGLFRIGDRLHDHFGHSTHENDRALVHEVRASLNHTRQNFRPSIEAGPLATLSKDLVKYLRHFIYKRGYDDYHYELAEIDLGDGNWDYLLRFRPKRAPGELEEDRVITGGKIRKHIFVGSMQIDPETYVIKNLHYEVGTEYRPHICSLGMDDLIHYGYRVDVDYQEYMGRWQMKRIQRLDQFLLPKTGKEKITPYEARTELLVTDAKVEAEGKGQQGFRNSNLLFLQDYHSPYNAAFWKSYESSNPESTISDSIKMHMEDEMSLEAQFALQGSRQREFQPPVARKDRDGTSANEDGYQWMHKQEFSSELTRYQKEELAYTEDYVKPFGKLTKDLQLDFKVAHEKSLKADTLADREYKNWAEFTDRKGFRKLLKSRKQYNVLTIGENEGLNAGRVTLIFVGEKKAKSLKKRPLVLSIEDDEKTGLQHPFDASIIPMLERGFVFAYANLKDAANHEPSWYLKGNSQQKLREVEKLVKMIDYLKTSRYADATKIFIRAEGSGAALVSQAMLSYDKLCLGAFLSSPLLSAGGILQSDYPGTEELTEGWNTQKTERKSQDLNRFSPYRLVGERTPGNIAYFIESRGAAQWAVLKMMAKLRAGPLKPETVLLKTYDKGRADREKSEPGISEWELDQYLLMLQWLENQRLAESATPLSSVDH